MGNQRGFIEIERKDPGYRTKKKRINDFAEVEKKPIDADIMQQAERCMDCGIPFCHGSGCPLSNLIPEWNGMLAGGHWEKALNILLSTNNFPEFTGRICPALCEASCTAGLCTDPVAIRHIELALIEKGFESGFISPAPPRTRTGKKIAVIGSGPTGLAAADTLNSMGHSVTVFEKNAKPGGLLRYGIPDFKLDKGVIDRRIELMKNEGIAFEASVEIGNDLSGDYLLKKFDIAAITTGSEIPRDLTIDGRGSKGIYFAMDYLTLQNKKNWGEVNSIKKICAKGKNVLVIGGGDTGSDCVGTAIRQGASSVTQIEIMPKPPEKRSTYTPWPQWPYQLRTSSSHKEGCKRLWNIKSLSFSSAKGKVTGLNAIKVEWETDENGFPTAMKDIKGSEFTINADLVLLAMGFTGAASSVTETFGVALTERGMIAVDEDGKTNSKNVFAAGDSVTGPSLVVRAISSGRNLAEKINSYIV